MFLRWLVKALHLGHLPKTNPAYFKTLSSVNICVTPHHFINNRSGCYVDSAVWCNIQRRDITLSVTYSKPTPRCRKMLVCTCWSSHSIQRYNASLQQEIQGLRGCASCLRSEPEFEMADIFYFCRRGVESIVDDEVTKRFSAQELESWNLLTRSDYNFRYISLRLTVLWGLGVLIRYGILLPLRSEAVRFSS